MTPAAAALVHYTGKHRLSQSDFMMPGLADPDDSPAVLVVDRRSEQMPPEVLTEPGLRDLSPPPRKMPY